MKACVIVDRSGNGWLQTKGPEGELRRRDLGRITRAAAEKLAFLRALPLRVSKERGRP